MKKEDRIAATLVEGKIGFIYSSDNGSKKSADGSRTEAGL